jgi:hypothetical protein
MARFLVKRFHTKRPQRPRLYDMTYCSIKGFKSYEDAETAANSIAQQVETGTWTSPAT